MATWPQWSMRRPKKQLNCLSGKVLTDQPDLQGKARWRLERPQVSLSATTQPGTAGSSHALPSSLSIPENPNPVAEVSPLQTPEVTPGQRDHRSRLQNRLYPAVQTIRDVMDHKWRASDLGPARDEAESGLGSSPSEVLGLKTDADGVTRNAQSRSARATRRIGLWAESDYPLFNRVEDRK